MELARIETRDSCPGTANFFIIEFIIILKQTEHSHMFYHTSSSNNIKPHKPYSY